LGATALIPAAAAVAAEALMKLRRESDLVIVHLPLGQSGESTMGCRQHLQ
jgi:lactate dehydrogenase-like 2-hydroxyacid dehydrogenase